MPKKGENWTTTAKFGREGVEISTENKTLAFIVVGAVVAIALFLLARELLNIVGHFVSAWAGSAFALLFLVGAIGYMEASQRGRKKAIIFPWISANPRYALIALASASLLMALATMGAGEPSAPAATAP